MAIGIFLLRGQGLALMAGIVIAGISAAANSQLAAILAILGDPLDRSGFLIVRPSPQPAWSERRLSHPTVKSSTVS